MYFVVWVSPVVESSSLVQQSSPVVSSPVIVPTHVKYKGVALKVYSRVNAHAQVYYAASILG